MPLVTERQPVSRATARRVWPRAVQRALHLYWWVSRGMTLGVRAAVLDGEGAVFLVRHTYVSGWHLPGGGVEWRETLRDALEKELREEANIALAGEPALFGMYLNAHASRRDHVALYVVRAFTQHGPRHADREIAEARFFPLSDLPEDTTPATRRRLAEIAGEAAISPHW